MGSSPSADALNAVFETPPDQLQTNCRPNGWHDFGSIVVMSEEVQEISWGDFLTEHPPSSLVSVTDLSGGESERYKLETPLIKLYCGAAHCEREQIFFCYHAPTVWLKEDTVDVFLKYVCRNCRESTTHFAVKVKRLIDTTNGNVCKYGQWPPYGPVVPARVLRLIDDQDDVQLFLKGRRSENHGLGIGAFTYYRRVVENQRARIFDKIIKVATIGGARKGDIASLEAAKRNFKFKESVAQIKPYMPESLLISGQNPLDLLHSALSKGVHELTDESCLQMARHVRVVLTAFAGKVAEALREDSDLAASVSSLMKPAQASTRDTESGEDAEGV